MSDDPIFDFSFLHTVSDCVLVKNHRGLNPKNIVMQKELSERYSSSLAQAPACAVKAKNIYPGETLE
tara:strand:- start:90 stop:290 length:201 start_codon:yes stop_codon:yes gene_type:complete